MNHLAHVVLAEPTASSRLGNLIADFLKPMEVQALPAEVHRGVMQHRAVDGFTDRHPLVHRALARLPEKWGWFKGIIMDVYFDYLLVRSWDHLGLQPFRAFLDLVNKQLREVARQAGEARVDLERIVDGDRLASYANRRGIETALQRITGILRARIPARAMDLVPALPDLDAVHLELLADFRQFFPELQQFSQDWLRSHPAAASSPGSIPPPSG